MSLARGQMGRREECECDLTVGVSGERREAPRVRCTPG